MALHLDRAMGIGEDVAAEYLNYLKEHDQVSSSVDSVADLKKYLSDRVYDFVFAHPQKSDDGMLDEISMIYDDDILPERESMGKRL